MRISQRLKDIEYQVLKNLWFEPTDAQLVRMVKRIMHSALRQAATRGEDLSAFAVDPSRPTAIMGVALNFATEGENVGKVFSLERGEITLNEDLETAPTDLGHIEIPPNIGIPEIGALFDLWGWGTSMDGALGNGSTDTLWTPARIDAEQLIVDQPIEPQRFTTLSTRGQHVLAIANEELYAWGANTFGQLGIGTTSSFESTPQKVEVPGVTWAQVAAGGSHSMGITTDGDLYTWGSSQAGQVGDGTDTMTIFDHQVLSPQKIGELKWAHIAAGSLHSLGITVDGDLYAFGANWFGQAGIGDSSIAHVMSPMKVGALKWTTIGAGEDTSFGITDDGTIYAWGSGENGRLGTGDTTERTSPTEIAAGLGLVYITGNSHTVALDQNGLLYTWGWNHRGQLGLGSTTQQTTPQQVGTSEWKAVSAGAAITFGITKADDLLYTWGQGQGGALGDGSTSNITTPQQQGTAKWQAVVAGSQFGLALQLP